MELAARNVGAVLPRRHPGKPLKGAIEMTLIAKSGFDRDSRERTFSQGELL
jgi:hypothetical protein